jgi:hypothetical protein
MIYESIFHVVFLNWLTTSWHLHLSNGIFYFFFFLKKEILRLDFRGVNQPSPFITNMLMHRSDIQFLDLRFKDIFNK